MEKVDSQTENIIESSLTSYNEVEKVPTETIEEVVEVRIEIGVYSREVASQLHDEYFGD